MERTGVGGPQRTSTRHGRHNDAVVGEVGRYQAVEALENNQRQLALQRKTLASVLCSGMTKYRKGPTKDPQRTAKEHYGLSCRKLAPVELNGALYSSARQNFSHAAGLS